MTDAMRQPGAAIGMKLRLRSDLKAAMIKRRATDAALLRGLLAALDNAEAVPLREGPTHPAMATGPSEVERIVLGPVEVKNILLTEIAEREAAAAEMEQAGQTDRAQRLRSEAEFAKRYIDECVC